MHSLQKGKGWVFVGRAQFFLQPNPSLWAGVPFEQPEASNFFLFKPLDSVSFCSKGLTGDESLTHPHPTHPNPPMTHSVYEQLFINAVRVVQNILSVFRKATLEFIVFLTQGIFQAQNEFPIQEQFVVALT